jgi:hypothetical protein
MRSRSPDFKFLCLGVSLLLNNSLSRATAWQVVHVSTLSKQHNHSLNAIQLQKQQDIQAVVSSISISFTQWMPFWSVADSQGVSVYIVVSKSKLPLRAAVHTQGVMVTHNVHHFLCTAQCHVETLAICKKANTTASAHTGQHNNIGFTTLHRIHRYHIHLALY